MQKSNQIYYAKCAQVQALNGLKNTKKRLEPAAALKPKLIINCLTFLYLTASFFLCFYYVATHYYYI